jgi:hypothetical protein
MKIIKPDMRMGTLSDSAIFKSMDMKYILFLILNDKSSGIKLLFVHNFHQMMINRGQVLQIQSKFQQKENVN